MDFKESVKKLTLDEKVRLLTGEDFWTTYALPSVGLRKMVVSDGPSGVRGELWDERSPSLSLPSATAFASTWDLEVLGQVGEGTIAIDPAAQGLEIARHALRGEGPGEGHVLQGKTV